MVGMMTSSQNF